MALHTKKINDAVVKPLKIKRPNPANVLAKEMFANPYCNIALVARKNSGKTTTIYRILEACCDMNTSVYIFCPTANHDPTYGHILSMLNRKRRSKWAMGKTMVFPDLSELKGVVDLILQSDDKAASHRGEPESTSGVRALCRFDGPEKKQEIEPGPPVLKHVAAEHIFILDDLGDAIRSDCVTQLMRMHRHIHSKVIMSCQNPTNIHPHGWKQIDYALCFPAVDRDRMLKLHEYMDLDITPDKFLQLYNDATGERFNFLYIDANSKPSRFRHNFTHEYNL